MINKILASIPFLLLCVVNLHAWKVEKAGTTQLKLDDSGNLGIDTANPGQKLTIHQGNIEIGHSTEANKHGIIYNGSLPFMHDFKNTNTNGGNTFVDLSVENLVGDSGNYLANGETKKTGDSCIYIGSTSSAKVDGSSNEIVVTTNAVGGGSNTVTLGNSDTTTITVLSDERDKKNIVDNTLGLNFINKVKTGNFKWATRKDNLKSLVCQDHPYSDICIEPVNVVFKS
ncbi:MAG TPA: tail fiber domain-containing protein [Campylobacterales bacterium]|nr:tail fiber domain-containing protein [Sulfurimonas sp.]HIP60637.1 tail fiber domain-containing protein [Campylobacterales bacterium]